MGFVTSLLKAPVRIASCAVLLVSCLTAAVVQVQAASTVQIYGNVYDAQSQPVEGVSVYATTPGGSDAIYGPISTDVDGAYTLGVAYKSTYDIHFVPAEGSTLEGVVVPGYAVVRADRQLDANLQTTQAHTFSGNVLDADGNPVEGIEVRTESTAGGTDTVLTDSNGDFTASRSSDIYTVTLAKTDAGTALAYPFFELAEGTADITAGNAIQNYQLPAVLHASVTVHDRFGAASTGQEVSYAAGSAESFTAATDSEGIAQLPLLTGVAIPEGAICSTFTQTNATLCSTASYDGTSDISLELNAPLKSIFSGVITDSENNPVENIHVKLTAQSDGSVIEGVTDSNGVYSIVTDPGLYDAVVTDNGSDNSTIKHWSVFSLDEGTVDLASDVAQDYQLPAIRQLQVTITGNPENIVTLQRNGTEFSQSVGNTANLVVLEGDTIAAGSLCVSYYGSNADAECNSTDIVIGSTDAAYTFTAPEMYTFSGQVLNVDGTPAKNKGIYLQIGDNLQVSAVGKSASFTIRLTPGSYAVRIVNTGGTIDMDGGTVDITDADVPQTYQLTE